MGRVVRTAITLVIGMLLLYGIGQYLRHPTTSSPGVSPAAASASGSTSEAEADVVWTTTKVTGITDGDTIKTAKGKVRIIGIDTPERGECNYRAATRYLSGLIPKGTEVRLGRVLTMADEDRYGRLVRYVETIDGLDVGAEQIRAGLAIKRYDSEDGYGVHPREALYRQLEQEAAEIDCAA